MTHSWWSINAWRWGIQIGPLVVATYVRLDALRIVSLSWFGTDIWANRKPLDTAVVMAEIERWKRYYLKRPEARQLTP